MQRCADNASPDVETSLPLEQKSKIVTTSGEDRMKKKYTYAMVVMLAVEGLDAALSGDPKKCRKNVPPGGSIQGQEKVYMRCIIDEKKQRASMRQKTNTDLLQIFFNDYI